MIIDKVKFSQLVMHIKSLSTYAFNLHGTDITNAANPRGLDELSDIINRINEHYNNLIGIMVIEDNITDEIMKTDMLSLIGLLKDNISGIKNCSGDLYNSIRFILDMNIYDVEYSERQICTNCGGMMVYEKKYLKCDVCEAIKYNNIDNYNIDISSNSEIVNRNNNIVKHFHKNLSYIYGESLPDKLPEKVTDEICKEIRESLPDLAETVHPSYEVHELLQNMRLIKHENRYYKPKEFKTYANSFIQRAFPEIIIPKLHSEDHDFMHNLFLEITAEQLNINTQDVSANASKYNNNYQFTMHRIIMMSKLYDLSYIRELMRFIFIQSPSSFEHKDKKLMKVNNNIRCFPKFFYTPLDIYINYRYYVR